MQNINTVHPYENATGILPIRMTNDYMFKILLQKNRHVLKSLICALLHLNPDSIKKMYVTNPIRPGDSINYKTIVLDVNVSFNDDTIINLEMQVANEHNWIERSIYYTCKNYTCLQTGDTYEQIGRSIQIGFLDFALFPDAPSFYSTYLLMDVCTHRLYTDKFAIGVVDLSRTDLATAEDKRYNIDKWALLFKSQTWEDIKMLAEQNIVFQEAADTIYEVSTDEHFRQICEAREDALRRERGWAYREEQLRNQLAAKNAALADKDDIIAQYRRLYGDLPKE